MIVRTSDGDRVVTQSTWMISQSGSWDAQIQSSLGVTEWSRSFGPGSPPPAMYLPAVKCAVQLISEAVGSMVMRTYTGDALERKPVYDSPQAQLFQDPAPSLGSGNQGYSSFDFWSDTVAACETNEFAVLWKVRDRSGAVVELWPLDPAYFDLQGDGASRRVCGMQDGRVVDVTNDVTIIRSWAGHPAVKGWSSLDLGDKTFKWGRQAEAYRGRYFERDGQVDQVIENGPSVKEARDEMALGWYVAQRKRNIGILWGGATLKQMAPSMSDAQAAELSISIAQDVARMFGVYPAFLLYADANPERFPTLEMPRGIFYTWTLMRRMRRLERALAADRDIFPDVALYPRFDASDYLRADLQTMSTVAHNAIQDRSMKPNEGRALVLGLPPIAGGDEIPQEVPVGAPAATNGTAQMSLEGLAPLLATLNGGHDE